MLESIYPGLLRGDLHQWGRIELPGGVEEFIDIAERTLQELRDSDNTGIAHPDIWFGDVKSAPKLMNDLEEGSDIDNESLYD